MTVAELIAELQKLDPNIKVGVWEYQGADYAEVVEATEVESTETRVVII